MVRRWFYGFSILSCILVAILHHYWHSAFYLFFFILPLIALGLYDIQSPHNVLRNYPILGHFRYMFEFIRPEIQQYFIATNLSGRPYPREVRNLIYQRANLENDTHPFGTEHDINVSGYEYTQHSLSVKKVPEDAARVTVGGKDCSQPYHASRINISAMSFGAISKNAVRAMNRGAKLGGFAQNTGEGGLSQYHLQEGGDLIWQIGTGYFGCRTPEGGFDATKFEEKSKNPVVKMIEIKLSQGAKPSHGGVLPASKISEEIAKIRDIPMDQDCLSPPTHLEFSDPMGLLNFVQRCRQLSGGKPVGFKLCIGRREEFMGICKAMLKSNILPDFITVDGAEGGTGAAPLEYTNRFGTPINEALAFVHNCLVGIGLRNQIRIIASGKVATGFDVVMKIALGADMINLARPMMFAVGCIQALRCHENTCPTGVATQDPKRVMALNIDRKGPHVYHYHKLTMKSFLELTGAMGLDSPDKLTPAHIYYRLSEGESINFNEVFHYIAPNSLLGDNLDVHYQAAWEASSATHF